MWIMGQRNHIAQHYNLRLLTQGDHSHYKWRRGAGVVAYYIGINGESPSVEGLRPEIIHIGVIVKYGRGTVDRS